MFWSQMNLVHNLPIDHIIGADESLWWNKEEKKALELINHQLSYVRFGQEDSTIPVVQENGCLGYEIMEEDGELVSGLGPIYQEFFSNHLDIGSYLGTVDFGKNIETNMACYNCGQEYENEHGEQDWQDHVDGYGHDGQGFGLWFKGTNEQVMKNNAPCPKCGQDCETVYYDEGGDVDTVWIFEKASIAYSHYGRGAKLSFRFHDSLGDSKIKENPMEYFKMLKDER